jgi:hypothetical protein
MAIALLVLIPAPQHVIEPVQRDGHQSATAKRWHSPNLVDGALCRLFLID